MTERGELAQGCSRARSRRAEMLDPSAQRRELMEGREGQKGDMGIGAACARDDPQLLKMMHALEEVFRHLKHGLPVLDQTERRDPV